MSKSTYAVAVDKITCDLRDALDRVQPIADAESSVGAVAGHRAILAAREALSELVEFRMNLLRDELHANLPRLSGGAPDPSDFEDIDPQFISHPDEWPAFPHPEVDGFIWQCLEPTPAEVLARDMAAAWEPSDADWEDYFACRGESLAELDHIVAHGCI